MIFSSIKTSQTSNINRKKEVDSKKVLVPKIPNRIEDMSPLPQHSKKKSHVKVDYSPDFALKVNNGL